MQILKHLKQLFFYSLKRKYSKKFNGKTTWFFPLICSNLIIQQSKRMLNTFW